MGKESRPADNLPSGVSPHVEVIRPDDFLVENFGQAVGIENPRAVGRNLDPSTDLVEGLCGIEDCHLVPLLG